MAARLTRRQALAFAGSLATGIGLAARAAGAAPCR
jgi:hypothetical protein